jgi:hypothetical protein
MFWFAFVFGIVGHNVSYVIVLEYGEHSFKPSKTLEKKYACCLKWSFLTAALRVSNNYETFHKLALFPSSGEGRDFSTLLS